MARRWLAAVWGLMNRRRAMARFEQRGGHQLEHVALTPGETLAVETAVRS